MSCFGKPHLHMAERLAQLFKDACDRNFFKDMNTADFSLSAAAFLVELNLIHPFREGNGPAQRVLVSQMAQRAGLQMGWSGISEAKMRQACIAGLQGDAQPMAKLFKVYLSPLPVALG
jgi:cell filamentation protein